MRSFRRRVFVLIGFVLGVAAGTAAVPRQPQPLSYHNFADQRVMLGVPNLHDVASNGPFVLVGAMGLWFLLTRGRRSLQPPEMWAYGTLFAGLALTGFGSMYYHWAPSNDTLVWDRLPLTIAFMGLAAGLVAERISVRAAAWLLAPLVAAGAYSVIHWHLGEQRGEGDLRPYLLVQFLPLLCIPLLVWLFPARYLDARRVVESLLWYVLAKGFEFADRLIFDLNGYVSGHTLKHLAAAMGAYWFLKMLREGLQRTPPAPRTGS